MSAKKLSKTSSHAFQRTWDNWTTIEDLAILWNISKRRVQQIVKERIEKGQVIVGALSYIEIDPKLQNVMQGRPLVTQKPVYCLVD